MQQSHSATNEFQEDEIDLRELFKILVRYKIFIAIFTFIITVSAIIYAYTKTPIYEVKSNVELGFIGENLIVEPEILVKKLNIVFNIEDKISSKEKFISEVTSISTNKKLKNFIEIKTQAISNEEALKKNKEVVSFVKNSYQSKIDQYIKETEYSIEGTKRAINNVDSFEIKNIEQEIKLLKEQAIVKIDEELKFLKVFKLQTIEQKISFHTKKLDEYTLSVNKLYSDVKKNQETAISSIASMQMVNYQNLILDSQNKSEDLKTEKEFMLTQTIPALEVEKNNILNEQIRKLQHQIDVELVSKKIKLNEKIDKLNYSITEYNIRNSRVVGDFIVKDYPVKPKKRLIVVVAFVSGLILSIFIVFFLNFFRDEKTKEAVV